jgi:hypothetical protein
METSLYHAALPFREREPADICIKLCEMTVAHYPDCPAPGHRIMHYIFTSRPSDVCNSHVRSEEDRLVGNGDFFIKSGFLDRDGFPRDPVRCSEKLHFLDFRKLGFFRSGRRELRRETTDEVVGTPYHRVEEERPPFK